MTMEIKTMNSPMNREELHAALQRGMLYLNTAESGTNEANIQMAESPSNIDELPESVEFDSIAYTGSVIKQGWSWWPIVVDIQGVDAFLPLPALADHTNKCSSSLGQHESVSLINNEITSSGKIYPRYSPVAANIFNTAKLGQRWQMSIAGPIRSIEELKEGEQIEVNGETFHGPIYIVRRMTVREITVVPVGADVDTELTIK
jgi:hypothetical protein